MTRTIHSRGSRIGLGLGALLCVAACSKAQGQELPPPSASEPPPQIALEGTATRATQPAPELIASGETYALRQAELSAKSTGTLEGVSVEEGDRVKKGQILFRIDASSAALQARQAQAQLSSARVALASADLDFRRTSELSARGAVSPVALEGAKLKYDQAQVAIEQAEVAVATARKASADTVVRSPIDGVVAKKLKQAGESVAANGAPVLIVQDISKVEVRVNLPETALASVRSGDRMHVRVRALGRTLEAQVDRLNPSVDKRSRTVEIVGVLDNAGGDLKSGLLTEVVFPDAKLAAVPSAADAPSVKAQGSAP